MELLSEVPRKDMSAITDRLRGLQEKLIAIEGEKVDSTFRSPDDAEKISRGQAVLDAILSECFGLVAEIQS
jgi:hypothetical protein